MQIGAIQKDLPVPPKPEFVFGAEAKYGFDELAVGDSRAYLPDALPEGVQWEEKALAKEVKRIYVNLSSALKRFIGKDGNGAMRFEVRRFADGVRVWRVADVVAVPPPPPAASGKKKK